MIKAAKQNYDSMTSLELFSEAQKYGLDRDLNFMQIFSLFRNLESDSILRNLVVEAVKDAKTNALMDPNKFRNSSPTKWENISGDITIGATLENNLFGLNHEELKRHILLTGSSGSGKSSIIKLIAAQIIKGND